MKKTALLAAWLFLLGYVFAQQPVTVDIQTFQVNQDGSLTPATTVGDTGIVEYLLRVRNEGSRVLPPSTVIITAPVAAQTAYVPDSATNNDSLLVEYSRDGQIFSRESMEDPRHIRWTYLEVMNPNQTLDLLYRAQLATSVTSVPPVSRSLPGSPIEAFTQAMFGHLGVVEVGCPANFLKQGTSYICGETRHSFDRFQQMWDLHADWESQVPLVPTPLTAWRRDETNYNRTYAVDDRVFIVFYFDGLIVIGYQ
jgi:uncharacterized repeat protein (TIGR01451 family)